VAHSQGGRLADPVAVLRPLLEARPLGNAVNVDGARDVAATVVAELPRRSILLQMCTKFSRRF
jgi:hypothetical protein